MQTNLASARPSGARLRPPTDAPTLTIVVTSTGPRQRLSSCLASLRPQCERAGVEVIVVRIGTPAELAELRAALPTVRFIGAAPSMRVSWLRRLGMAEASGDIVAVTDDHSVVEEHWVEMLLGRAHGPVSVMDGSDDDARRDPATDWMARLAEYGCAIPGEIHRSAAVPSGEGIH